MFKTNPIMKLTIRSKEILSFVLFAAAWIPSMYAQMDSSMTTMTISPSPIETDRPDQTETASLVPVGYIQLETGFSIEDTEPGFLYTYPSALLKYGVSENFEVRVVAEYINIQREPNPNVDGMLPLRLGLKTKLFDQNGIIPKTSLLGHISLPGIASEQFREPFFAPDLRLLFLHTLDRFSVSYNVGAEWDGFQARPDFIYSLSLGANIAGGLGIFVEGYGRVPQQREDENELRMDAGLTYLINNDVQVDLSGGIGLTDNAPEKYVALGLSFRLNP